VAKHKQAKIVIYQDSSGEWRWRLVAKNGRIVADSAEGYSKLSNAERAASRFLDIVFDAFGNIDIVRP
jgi:uncharacterized protein YegP (UPF0339 family)